MPNKMAVNRSLHAAKRNKKDEFYTQLSDIENELRYYKEHFRGKIVYCNCDDPTESNFYKYFAANFSHLKLKGLIATCYKNRQRDLFSQHDSDQGLKIEYKGFRKGEKIYRVKDAKTTLLEDDGDFRSPECVELLKRADIVVTNPPFSLFREYVAQLVNYDKKFLIVGNHNAITYKEIFPLIKDNLVWLGITPKGQDMLFDVPKHYVQELVKKGKEGSAYKIVDGQVYGRLGNAAWYTNLDHKKRHEKLTLYRRYTSENYLHYDNYDAINVDKVKDIPEDWNGMMGVPITFLDKYNPDQFEIKGITKTWFGAATKTYPPQVQVDTSGKQSEVTKLNDGASLQVAGPIDKTYYMVDGKYYIQVYARILIKPKRG